MILKLIKNILFFGMLYIGIGIVWFGITLFTTNSQIGQSGSWAGSAIFGWPLGILQSIFTKTNPSGPSSSVSTL